jgi:probable O-glycosylation ligase (exosortase A-associated)
VSHGDAGTIWWRPDGGAAPLRAAAVSPGTAGSAGSRVAFNALVAFTGILLLTPQTMIPVLKSLRIALVAGGLAIIGHMFDATLRRRAMLPAAPEVVTALTLLIWAVLTIPFSYWPGGSVALLGDQYLKAVVFFWLIAAIITTRERLRTFGWALVICSIPLALTALTHFGSGVYVTSSRAPLQRIGGIAGLTGNPNDLALTLNLLIPIAGALLFTSRGLLPRAVAAGALLLSIPAVIVTFSRAGFLTLCAIAIASLFCFIRRRATGPAAAILAVTCGVMSFLPSGYLDRLNTITDIEADQTGSAVGRWTDYQLAIQLVARNPVLGVGMGQDILALDQIRIRPTWRNVHNAYLEYAVDLGVPGLLLFLALLVASMKSARRVEMRAAREPALRDLSILASGVRIALLAFVVGAFFHPIAYQFYFFCVAGLAVALKRVCQSELDRIHVRA